MEVEEKTEKPEAEDTTPRDMAMQDVTPTDSSKMSMIIHP